jgi:DNA-binding NarL/FixJ family response regulator
MGANSLRAIEAIRVVIAEDEVLIRAGLQAVLEDGDFEIVRIVGNARDLLAAVREEQPGLVITDIRMPPNFADEGLVAALEIRGAWPAIAVCVLSQHVLAHSARTLIDVRGGAQVGGVGYLLKQRITHIDEFLLDLSRIVAGEVVLDPSVVEQLLARADRAGTPVATLTPRQRAVLALVAEGRSNAAIAAMLAITEKTVVNHLTGIYTTLGLEPGDNTHRRVQAVLAYLSSR